MAARIDEGGREAGIIVAILADSPAPEKPAEAAPQSQFLNSDIP
jgi:hypothetical protein